MTNDELEAIRARASEIVIARRETHERDKAVMFQAAADRRNLIAAYDALETNALRELADAQTAYVARGMELRDAQARLARELDGIKALEAVVVSRGARLSAAEALLRECRHFVKALCDHDDPTCGCYQHIVLRGIDAFLAPDSASVPIKGGVPLSDYIAEMEKDPEMKAELDKARKRVKAMLADQPTERVK